MARPSSVEPATSHLLGASLQCDRIAGRYQGAYWAVAAVGIVTLAFSPYANGEGAYLLDALTVVQGATALVFYSLTVRWRDRGSVLRGDFERATFGFPGWHRQWSPGRPVQRWYDQYVAGPNRLPDKWFDPPAGLTHAQEVIACQHESLVFGQRLRLAWTICLGLICLAFGGGIVLALALSWPRSGPNFAAAIVLGAAILATGAEARASYDYAMDRRELARFIERATADAAIDLDEVAVIVQERLGAVRRNRIIVPRLVYLGSRPALNALRPAGPVFAIRDAQPIPGAVGCRPR